MKSHKNIWNPNNDMAFYAISEYVSEVIRGNRSEINHYEVRRICEDSIFVHINKFGTGATITFDVIRNSNDDAEIFSIIINSSTEIEEQIVNSVYNKNIFSKEIIDNIVIGMKRQGLCDTIKNKIEQNNDVFIVGNSSSGKTTAVAIVAKELMALGNSLYWFDLNDNEIDYLTIAYHLINSNERNNFIVIDNVQSAPQEIARIKKVVDSLRNGGMLVKVILIGWESAQNIINYTFPKAIKIACKPNETILRLLADYSELDKTVVLSKAKGDVLIAKRIIEYYDKEKQIPTLDELIKQTLRDININLQTDEANILLQIAVLGQFEIFPTIQYLSVQNIEAVEKVRKLPFIRMVGGSISIGHRSFANLVVKYLQRTYSAFFEFDPITFTVNYLKTVGNKQILTTLERIALIKTSEGGTEDEDFRLRKIWQAFIKLQNYLYDAIETDPRWNDNMASVIFAAEALSKMSFAPNAADYWEKENAALEKSWIITPEKLVLHGNMTQERKDFDEILIKMKEEDEIDSPNFEGGMSVSEFDALALDKFHKTWLLGLLLGYEGAKLKRDNDKIKVLIQELEDCRLQNGAFFPHRVPWVTARVIIGLSMCDETLNSNFLLRSACEWLLDDYPNGAYKNGKWDSGTGSWNTDIQVTWMCINALLRAGYPQNNTKIQKALQWLNTKKYKWTAARKEIDAAFAIDTLILLDKNLDDFSSELDSIINWCDNSSLWTRATLSAKEAQDESSKVPFIAKVLIETTWQILVKELATLLKGLDTTYIPVPTSSSTGVLNESNDFSSLINRIQNLSNDMKNKKPSYRTAPNSLAIIDNLISELDSLLLLINNKRVSTSDVEMKIDIIVESYKELM